jgi:hypothetical protein
MKSSMISSSQPRSVAAVRKSTTGAGSLPIYVALSDFNYDSILDIAVVDDGTDSIVIANYGTGNVGILLGYGNKTFKNMKKSSTGIGSAPSSVAIGHLNNDSHLDIVVSNSQTDNIAILFGYGNGTFTTPMTYSTGIRSQPYIQSP